MLFLKQSCFYLIGICMLFQGCESVIGKQVRISMDDKNNDLVYFEGKVVFLTFEGGFWGIVSSDGQKYNPYSELPDKFMIEGMEVKGKLRKIKDGVGFQMWGELVDIVEIETAGK